LFLVVTTRRKHERTETRDHVLQFRVGDRVVRAPVVNVSRGGVFARADVVLERGTYLECVMEAPGANECFGAIVVHPSTERGGIALRFTRERAPALMARGDRRSEAGDRRRVDHSARAQIASLQREVKKLTAENAALREEVDAADDTYRLVGKLQQQVAERHTNRR
jgi:hypothetical protein